MSTQDPLVLGAEIEQLLAKLSAQDATVSADVRRLTALLMSFYEAGLARLLDVVRGDAHGAAIIDRLRAEPLVRGLLTAHDLLPGEGAALPLLQIIRSSEAREHDRPPEEQPCELCGQPIPQGHGHVVDVNHRRLLCVCGACSGVGGRFRRVPTRYARLPPVTSAQWDALGLPVGLVFLVANSQTGTVTASYPGPAGATESVLPLDAWPALVADRRELRDVAPDVEAVLVRRAGDEYHCYVVPIDACYELIGRIRRAWTGFGGGTAVEEAIDRFFGSVIQKASPSAEVWA